MAEHALVQLARRTIERYIREHEVLAEPAELTPEMRERAGAFVSLHRGGQLRGCIGTIEPTRPNAAQEIIRNAISAAVHDPRFAPLRADELDSLEISVDLLGAAEPIESLDQLDPKRYGVIVSFGNRRGLLLPDLEGVDTPQYQVQIALQKAGIRPSERYQLKRFEVHRFI
ncbi:MAG: AmmeMemoRadiSam system protein A [Chloroflexi bacterium]|nr:AmmeMemoRadiSam system protein A [Chloroflexota bacterium]